ncbi:MAG: hypothetical protein HOQ11_05510, partial [Gemmatimonadaceae bacterium]|nr:hypothetical protein [Gemmatimonadaceae bacterium]
LAPAACIGPITAQAARDAGLEVGVESATSTTAALADALAVAWRSPEERSRAEGNDGR